MIDIFSGENTSHTLFVRIMSIKLWLRVKCSTYIHDFVPEFWRACTTYEYSIWVQISAAFCRR